MKFNFDVLNTCFTLFCYPFGCEIILPFTAPGKCYAVRLMHLMKKIKKITITHIFVKKVLTWYIQFLLIKNTLWRCNHTCNFLWNGENFGHDKILGTQFILSYSFTHIYGSKVFHYQTFNKTNTENDTDWTSKGLFPPIIQLLYHLSIQSPFSAIKVLSQSNSFTLIFLGLRQGYGMPHISDYSQQKKPIYTSRNQEISIF